MSVRKYVVPHRDPSLLPRQWRIAMGIQKSYKVDPAKKQKRCKYEAERRRLADTSPDWTEICAATEFCENETMSLTLAAWISKKPMPSSAAPQYETEGFGPRSNGQRCA